MVARTAAHRVVSTPKPHPKLGNTPSIPELECGTFTNTEEHANSHDWRCQHLRPTRDARGQRVMRPCGRTSCSRQCRDVWAWKHWQCLARSFLTHPPAYHAGLHKKQRRSAKLFANDIGRLVARLRQSLGPTLQYSRIFEWRHGRMHAHLLLRGINENPGGEARRLLKTTRPGLYTMTCEKVRSVGAVARYFVKHLKNRLERADLTPKSFRGRVIQFSKDFLTKPFRALWRDIQAERREQTRNDARDSTDTAPLTHHIEPQQPLQKAA